MRCARGLLRFVLAAGTVGAAVGCEAGADPDPDPDIVIGRGEGLYPSTTLTDWVSWSLQLSQVLVLEESEIPPPQTVADRQEGYLGRKVRVRVERTIWTSPQATETAPAEFEFAVSGWVLRRGGKKIRFALLDCPRIEVGGRYLLPITTAPLFEPAPPNNTGMRRREPFISYTIGWSPLAGDAVFGVQGDQVSTADVEARGSGALAKSFVGKPDEEIRRALEMATFDPMVLPFMNLSPWDRWIAIWRPDLLPKPDAGPDGP